MQAKTLVRRILKIRFLHLCIPACIVTNASLQAQSWSLTGNGGTNPSNNFLGTTNNRALVVRTNNIERMGINQSGLVGIGINNQTLAKLVLDGTVDHTIVAAFCIIFSTVDGRFCFNNFCGCIYVVVACCT